MSTNQHGTGLPRPASWLTAGLAVVLAVACLYTPHRFSAEPLRYVAPYLWQFGLFFALGAALQMISLAEIGLPGWAGVLGRFMVAGSLVMWAWQVAFRTGIATGQVFYGLMALMGLLSLLPARFEPMATRGILALIALLLGALMQLRTDLFPLEVFGQLPPYLPWLMVAGGLTLALSPLLGRRYPPTVRAAWLLMALGMGAFAKAWNDVSNWLGVLVYGFVACCALVRAIRPGGLTSVLPTIRRRMVALTLAVTVIPVFTVGGVAVFFAHTLDRQSSALALALGAAEMEAEMLHLSETQPASPWLASSLEQAHERKPTGIASAVILRANLPEGWAGRVDLDRSEPQTLDWEHRIYLVVPRPDLDVALVLSRPRSEVFARTAAISQGMLLMTGLAAVVSAALALLWANSLVSRLLRIRQGAVSLADRQFRQRIDLSGGAPDEISDLALAINRTASTLETYEQEVESQHEELLEQAAELRTQSETLVLRSAALERRNRQQQALLQLGRAALNGDPADVLAETAISLIRETLGVTAAAYLEPLEGEESLVVKAGRWEDPSGRLATSAVTAALKGAGTDSVGFHIVPVAADRGVLGVLVADRPLGPPEAEEESEFLQAAASILAVALERRRSDARAQAEAQKRHFEHLRLLGVLGVLPVGVLFLDANGVITEANPAAELIWGQRARTGGSLADLRQVCTLLSPQGESTADDLCAFTRAISGDSVPLEEVTLIHAAGSRKTLLRAATPIVDHDGGIQSVVVVAVDITVRRSVEEALRESESLLADQNRILEMIAQGAPLQMSLNAIALFVEQNFDSAWCSVELLDQTGSVLNVEAAPSFPERFRTALGPIPVGPAGGACGAAAYRRAPVIAYDTQEAPCFPEPFQALAESVGIRSCWSIPIFASDGALLGVLSLYFRQPMVPDDRAERLVGALSYLAGIALERSRADEASSLKLQSLIDFMAQGVVAIDSRKRTVVVNAAAFDILGLEALPAEGTPLEAAGFPETLTALLYGGSEPEAYRVHQTIFHVGGREVEALISPVRSEVGPHYGAIALLRDITTESQFRRLQESFVANVSHELKGPLASLSAVIEAVADGMIPADQHKTYLRRILTEVGRMQRLTQDLIDLSRLEAGVTRFEAQEFELDLLLEGLELAWGHRTGAARIQLQVELSGLRVVADYDRVEQVMVNLMENAIRFTPAGGKIRISAAQEESWVRVSVSDTGIGIAPEHLPYLWERFFMVDQARTLKPERGSGLGLAIVRQLVVNMGGEVDVTSEPGQGSTFSFRLPSA